jgi:hypothetical protein
VRVTTFRYEASVNSSDAADEVPSVDSVYRGFNDPGSIGAGNSHETHRISPLTSCADKGIIPACSRFVIFVRVQIRALSPRAVKNFYGVLRPTVRREFYGSRGTRLYRA